MGFSEGAAVLNIVFTDSLNLALATRRSASACLRFNLSPTCAADASTSATSRACCNLSAKSPNALFGAVLLSSAVDTEISVEESVMSGLSHRAADEAALSGLSG